MPVASQIGLYFGRAAKVFNRTQASSAVSLNVDFGAELTLQVKSDAGYSGAKKRTYGNHIPGPDKLRRHGAPDARTQSGADCVPNIRADTSLTLESGRPHRLKTNFCRGCVLPQVVRLNTSAPIQHDRIG